MLMSGPLHSAALEPWRGFVRKDSTRELQREHMLGTASYRGIRLCFKAHDDIGADLDVEVRNDL